MRISTKLLEIDRSIRDLSLEEQMWLLESLVKNLRKKTNTNSLPLTYHLSITSSLSALRVSAVIYT